MDPTKTETKQGEKIKNNQSKTQNGERPLFLLYHHTISRLTKLQKNKTGFKIHKLVLEPIAKRSPYRESREARLRGVDGPVRQGGSGPSSRPVGALGPPVLLASRAVSHRGAHSATPVAKGDISGSGAFAIYVRYIRTIPAAARGPGMRWGPSLYVVLGPLSTRRIGVPRGPVRLGRPFFRRRGNLYGDI